MHDCISSNPLCFFDFRGLFLHFLLEYPPNFSPKFFGYTPKLFGYPKKRYDLRHTDSSSFKF